MILSDYSIKEIYNDGKLNVDPVDFEAQLQPASLDLRLGEEIFDAKYDMEYEIDDLLLVPGRRYLASTLETVSMPNDVAGQIAGRSTVGRKGIIVHMTAGWIDPGFEGEITLEMMNMGDDPVTLDEHQRVAQIVFFQLDRPAKEGYDGSYQHQTGPTEARGND